MKIVVAGGSGFLGRPLVERLLAAHHDVVILSRDPARVLRGRGVAWMQGESREWEREVATADAIVNLAGENIGAGRWTADRKKRIEKSRVRATGAIAGALRSAKRDAVLVNASGVGYYGPRGDEVLTEDSEAGNDFVADVCRSWEASALDARDRVRVVILRFGMALAKDGGALARMILPFRLFVGGYVGSGRQWMSWIDRDDALSMIVWAIETPSVSGVYNGTAPEPVRNREFARRLGAALHRPSFVPAPAFALRAMFGEMAESLLLAGQRAVPQRALSDGFEFRYPTLEASLRHAVSTR